MSALAVGVEFYQRAVVVSLAGLLTAATVSEARFSVGSFWPVAPRGALVLNVAALEQVDKSGMQLLLQLRRRAGDADVALVLAAPAGQLARRLVTYGLTGHFTICPALGAALLATDAGAALDRFRGPPAGQGPGSGRDAKD